MTGKLSLLVNASAGRSAIVKFWRTCEQTMGLENTCIHEMLEPEKLLSYLVGHVTVHTGTKGREHTAGAKYIRKQTIFTRDTRTDLELLARRKGLAKTVR